MGDGIIFDIKRFALHDGPGIRTTVFLKGCPLSCWWCHNPESQSASSYLLYRPQMCVRCGACIEVCPENGRQLSQDGVLRDSNRCTVCGACVEVCPSGALEKVGRRVTVDQVMNEIEKDTPFFDQSGGGVTFSGGEPLKQPEFLSELLDRCGERDIHKTVDTCGFVQHEVLLSIAERTDLFLFDLKFMDPERHVELTGVNNKLILENLRTLSGLGKEIHIRVPVIPSVTDSAENFDAIGSFVSSLAKPPSIRLLPHHPAAMEKYRRFNMARRLCADNFGPSRSELATLASRLETFGLDVSY